jgi:RNA polymerase sigma-70 factor (ECF subfamily)
LSLSDNDLIARVLVLDDRYAFGELVRQHQSAVRGFLRRLTSGRHALADDLAQETFLAAYRDLARFRGGSAFSTWLLGIAYNQFRSSRRRERDTVEWTGAVPASQALPGYEGAVPAVSAAIDLQQDLATALAQLTEDERAAIQLCYGEGLSHAEASAVLGSPLGTVKTHVLRAKVKLRRLLQAWAPT